MFDFIKPEKYGPLRKIFGIGTLLGVAFETLEETSKGDSVQAGFFGLCTIFMFFWALDAFKDLTKEALEHADE
jgi:hypothetical protein